MRVEGGIGERRRVVSRARVRRREVAGRRAGQGKGVEGRGGRR